MLNTLDSKKIIPLCEDSLKNERKSVISLNIENTNRALGTYLSGYIIRNKIKLQKILL